MILEIVSLVLSLLTIFLLWLFLPQDTPEDFVPLFL